MKPLIEEWVVLCVRRLFTVIKACESPTVTKSKGSAQHMVSIWGKSRISLMTSLDEPFERGGWQSLFHLGNLQHLPNWRRNVVIGRVGRPRWHFCSFTPRGKHILISSQCSVFTQHKRLPVKALNSAWTIKLRCDEKQGRTQEWNAWHVPALQPCGNATSPVHLSVVLTYNPFATGASLWHHCNTSYSAVLNIRETGNSYFYGEKEVTDLAL